MNLKKWNKRLADCICSALNFFCNMQCWNRSIWNSFNLANSHDWCWCRIPIAWDWTQVRINEIRLLGRIAIAGPMTNMGLALVFIIIAALIYPFSIHSQIVHLIYLICTVGYSVNSYLAAFNLLPFATLDGIKVMKWNILIWFVVFAIAAVMTLLSMTIGAENMVGLIIGM